MKIIKAEVLGICEQYKDPYDLPIDWHKKQLCRITETAYVKSYRTVRVNSKIDLEILPTIEDLFIKAHISWKPNY